MDTESHMGKAIVAHNTWQDIQLFQTNLQEVLDRLRGAGLHYTLLPQSIQCFHYTLHLNSPRVKLLHFPYHPHLPLNFLSPLPAAWTNEVSGNNQPQMCRVLNGDGTRGVCASSGLLGRFNFHHLAKNVALSDAAIAPTGFLWGDSVMRFWWWDPFHLWAHLLLITHEKACLWICMESPSPDLCLGGGVGVCGYVKKAGERGEKEKRGDLCSAPVKASDSWLTVYYCKWVCGTLRKPQEHYSRSQRGDRHRICLVLRIYPSALVFCFVHMVQV